MPLASIGNDKCKLLVNDGDLNNFERGQPFQTYVLAWKRREIKHYLLSYTALGEKREILNDVDVLTRPAFLYPSCNGDYLQKYKENEGVYTPLVEKEKGTKRNKEKVLVPEYNDALASLSSNLVKPLVSDFIEKSTEPKGFSIDKAADYISQIPPSEISEDIVAMYRFLVGEK